jgi:hypothetical protein
MTVKMNHRNGNYSLMTRMGSALFLFLMITLLPISATSRVIDFEATVSRNIVHVGESLQLSLKFKGTRDIPAPEIYDIDGFSIRYLGPSTMMSIVNGRMSSSITHIYRLVALKKGKFTLGPFTVKHKGDTYHSGAVTIEVIDRAASPVPPAARSGSSGGSIFLELNAAKENIYINEMVPVTIKLYVNGLNVRDIQYPEIDFDGFSAEELSRPRQYQEERDGIIYDVVEFGTRIFATKAGEFEIGPARLGATIMMKRRIRRPRSPFEDFFGHDPFEDFFGTFEREPVELKSEPLKLTVMPLPEEGRPPDFTGAVGEFRMSTEASPAEVRAGDPVTLKIQIEGEGNIAAVSIRGVEPRDGLKVYEPTAKTSGDRKTFEQIIIPLTARIEEIPEVSFSYFDPVAGAYRTIRNGPFPIKVMEPEKKETVTILEPPARGSRTVVSERLGRDIIYIKETPGTFRKQGAYLYQNGLYLSLHIVALMLFAGTLYLLRRREKMRADARYARRLSAPGKARKGIREAEAFYRQNKIQEFYDAVFRTLRDYAADRFGIPAGGLTADVLTALLREKGADEEVVTKTEAILTECDTARYAPATLSSAGMGTTLADMKWIINRLEKSKI